MVTEMEKPEMELGLPRTAREVLQGFVESAKAAFGDELVSVVLFGSGAEAKLRQSSDLNVMVVLSRFEATNADKLREPLRTAEAAARLRAMFVLEDEIADATRAFAQKFADILRRHKVVYGKDVLAGIHVERTAEIFRVQQVLLNLLMRMREVYVSRSLREEQIARALAEFSGPLRTSAAAMLELEGSGTLAPKDALVRVGKELGADRDSFAKALTSLSTAREQGTLPAGNATRTMLDAIELTQQMHQRAKKLH